MRERYVLVVSLLAVVTSLVGDCTAKIAREFVFVWIIGCNGFYWSDVGIARNVGQARKSVIRPLLRLQTCGQFISKHYFYFKT